METDFSAWLFWKPYFFVNNAPTPSTFLQDVLSTFYPSLELSSPVKDSSHVETAHSPTFLPHHTQGWGSWVLLLPDSCALLPLREAPTYIPPVTVMQPPPGHSSFTEHVRSRLILSFRATSRILSLKSSTLTLNIPLFGHNFPFFQLVFQSCCHLYLLLIFSAYPVGCYIPTNLGPC